MGEHVEQTTGIVDCGLHNNSIKFRKKYTYFNALLKLHDVLWLFLLYVVGFIVYNGKFMQANVFPPNLMIHISRKFNIDKTRHVIEYFSVAS